MELSYRVGERFADANVVDGVAHGGGGVMLWAGVCYGQRKQVHFTFTFMHLADTFIQSDLHCIQVTVSTFYQLLLSLGIEPMILALLAPCSTS